MPSFIHFQYLFTVLFFTPFFLAAIPFSDDPMVSAAPVFFDFFQSPTQTLTVTKTIHISITPTSTPSLPVLATPTTATTASYPSNTRTSTTYSTLTPSAELTVFTASTDSEQDDENKRKASRNLSTPTTIQPTSTSLLLTCSRQRTLNRLDPLRYPISPACLQLDRAIVNAAPSTTRTTTAILTRTTPSSFSSGISSFTPTSALSSRQKNMAESGRFVNLSMLKSQKTFDLTSNYAKTLGKYIVVFKKGTQPNVINDAVKQVEQSGGSIGHRYDAVLLGFSATIPDSTLGKHRFI